MALRKAQPRALPGRAPRPGETWIVEGPKGTVFSQHLFDIDAVRPFVPQGLRIVPVLPGKTPGFVCLTYYGPGSSVEYHELTVMSALVAFGATVGLWVSHIYVDSEPSQKAGLEIFGLPKQMATFEWEGGCPGLAKVSQDGRPVMTIEYGRPAFAVRFPVFGRALSVREGEVIFSRHRLSARYGFAQMQYHIPPESPLAPLNIGRPQLRLVGGPTTGYMGEGQRVLGTLMPNK